jgi:hypothetical protein
MAYAAAQTLAQLIAQKARHGIGTTQRLETALAKA